MTVDSTTQTHQQMGGLQVFQFRFKLTSSVCRCVQTTARIGKLCFSLLKLLENLNGDVQGNHTETGSQSTEKRV